MIHTLWHNLRSWKVWAGGIVLIGLVLIATQCSPGPQQTATPIAKNPPPRITGFTPDPSGPVPPGTRISIQVNVERNGHRINSYQWIVRVGEGRIVSGQGTPLITYEAPKTLGTCEVRMELEYEGGPPVKGSTTVEVVQPSPTSTATPTDTPTPTSTATSTPSPTNNPTPTPTFTPTPIPPTNTPTLTATPTTTPTPLPAPRLLEPKDAARFVGVVHLTWEWKVRPLAEDEYFSVRIRPERARSEDPIPTPCWHSAIKDSHYHGNISDYCTNGRHYWSVIVAREAPESPTGWEEVSVISEERWFDFFECFEEEDPKVCPRC